MKFADGKVERALGECLQSTDPGVVSAATRLFRQLVFGDAVAVEDDMDASQLTTFVVDNLHRVTRYVVGARLLHGSIGAGMDAKRLGRADGMVPFIINGMETGEERDQDAILALADELLDQDALDDTQLLTLCTNEVFTSDHSLLGDELKERGFLS